MWLYLFQREISPRILAPLLIITRHGTGYISQTVTGRSSILKLPFALIMRHNLRLFPESFGQISKGINANNTGDRLVFQLSVSIILSHWAQRRVNCKATVLQLYSINWTIILTHRYFMVTCCHENSSLALLQQRPAGINNEPLTIINGSSLSVRPAVS